MQTNLPPWAPEGTKVVLFGLYSDGSQVASIGTPFEFHPVVAFLLLDDVSRGRRQLSYKRVGYVQKVADKTLHPKLLELDKYALVAGLARLSCAACMFILPSWHAGQLQSVAAWSYPLSWMSGAACLCMTSTNDRSCTFHHHSSCVFLQSLS